MAEARYAATTTKRIGRTTVPAEQPTTQTGTGVQVGIHERKPLGQTPEAATASFMILP